MSRFGLLAITYGCGQKEIEGPWVGANQIGLSGIRSNVATSCLNSNNNTGPLGGEAFIGV